MPTVDYGFLALAICAAIVLIAGGEVALFLYTLKRLARAPDMIVEVILYLLFTAMGLCFLVVPGYRLMPLGQIVVAIGFVTGFAIMSWFFIVLANKRERRGTTKG